MIAVSGFIRCCDLSYLTEVLTPQRELLHRRRAVFLSRLHHLTPPSFTVSQPCCPIRVLFMLRCSLPHARLTFALSDYKLLYCHDIVRSHRCWLAS